MLKLYSKGKRIFLFCLTVVLVFAFGFGSVPVHATSLSSYTDNVTHLTWLYYADYDNKTAKLAIVRGLDSGDNEQNPITSLDIPEIIDNLTVTELDESVFSSANSRGSDKLVSITIPETIDNIPEYAFKGCTNLKTVNFLCKKLKSIGKYAFKECAALESLDYPESVTSIGDGAFSDCSAIESFTISDSVKELGDSVFKNCENLKSVSIGKSVPCVDENTFYRCGNLESVTIKGINTTIKDKAFIDCKSLNNITLPCNYDRSKIDSSYYLVVDSDTFTIKNSSVNGTFSCFHDYSDASYDWVDDNGVIKCIAQGECNCDDPHMGSDTVTAEGYVTTKPNCSQRGITTYVAKFENPGFCTQIFEVDNIEKNSDHSWNKTSCEWSTETGEDGNTIYKCTASRVCSRDETHIESETVIAKVNVITYATYDQEGEVRCVANFENSAFPRFIHDFTVPKLQKPAVAPIPLPDPGEPITEPIKVLSGQHPVIDQNSDVVLTSGGKAITVIADSYNVEWSLDNNDASLELNGNVSNSNKTVYSASGVSVQAYDGNASAKISGDIFIDGNDSATGARVYSNYNYPDLTASADIGGSITARSYEESYGLNMYYGRLNASVGKDISASSDLYSYGLEIEDAIGTASIGGTLKSEGVAAEALSLDIDTSLIASEFQNGEFRVNIGKDIIANAKECNYYIADRGAYGIMFYNNLSKVSVDVKGDVIANSPYNEAYGIKTEHYGEGHIFTGGPNDIQIHGNLKSNGTGIFIDTVGEDISNNILVENTIDARYPVVLQRSEYLSQMDNYDELQNTPSYMLDPTINLTAWKIIPDESGSIATVRDTDDPADFGLAPEGDLAENFEKSINYIIKYDQPEKGGTFALTDIDGNDLEKSYDLETAHEGDKVYIIPTIEEGYELKGVYNGVGDKRKELTTDEDGKYYIVVPKGGGIYISMDVEIPEAPTPTLAPTSVPTIEPTSDPSGEPSSIPSVSPSSAPTSGNDATPAPGEEATPTPGGVTPTSTPGGEVTPGNATPTPGVTPTPAGKKDNKTTFNIKNKSKVKSSAKIKIKDKDKIKKVTLNGKTIKIKKNKKKITIKLKSNKKKLLKNKKKWNKLVVTDKNGNKTTLKFKIK